MQYAGADSFAADFTLVSDGVPEEALDYNVAFEALGDRTKWLKNRIGTVFRTQTVFNTDSTFGLDVTDVSGPVTSSAILTTSSPAAIGDRCAVWVNSSYLFGATAGAGTFTVTLQVQENGGAWADTDSVVEFGFSGATGTGIRGAFSLMTRHAVAAAGTVAFRVKLTWLGGTTADAHLNNSWTALMEVERAT